MEENAQSGVLVNGQVNIPIQMVSLTDRDGRITPLWFRLETQDHQVRMYRIEQIAKWPDIKKENGSNSQS